MGILREERESEGPIHLEDHLEDYMLMESEGDESNSVHSLSAPPSPRQRRRQRKGKSGLIGQGPPMSRCSGRRKQRRIESARALAALVEVDEICEDLSDMLPDTISAFTRLFLEKQKMEVWNEFVEKSEDQQRQLLAGGYERGAGSSGGHVLGGGGARRCSRNDHPAFSPEACFRRIDSRFRGLLAHRSLPWAKLDRFETELVDYFSSFPDGVWIQRISEAYDRLLVHAIAQYLSLRSQSYDVNGERETQIENKKPFFVSPQQSLVDFMQQQRKNS